MEPCQRIHEQDKEIKLFQDQISSDEKISHRMERADAIIQMNVGDQNIGINNLEELQKNPLDGEVMMIWPFIILRIKILKKLSVLLSKPSSSELYI